MKAHVRKVSGQMEETVLMYCLDEEKAGKVRRILSGCCAAVLTAGPEDSGQTLGALFELPEFPRKEDAAQEPEAVQEALFFAGFRKDRLDLALSRIKAAGISIPFKAVLTPHNQGWTMYQLIGELTKEHQTFAKLDQLNTLSRQLMRYDPNKIADQPRKEALEALAKAQAIIKRPAGVPPETVDMTIAALQRSLAAAIAAGNS